VVVAASVSSAGWMSLSRQRRNDVHSRPGSPQIRSGGNVVEKVKGWSFVEVTGVCIVHPDLLLPREERERLQEERRKAREEFLRTGHVTFATMKEDALRADGVVTCPYGCAVGTEIRTFDTWSTLIAVDKERLDPNHYTMDALCKGCERRFTKHWVPSSGVGWYRDDHKVLILGAAVCCAKRGEAGYRAPIAEVSGSVYVVSDAEYVGELGIRVELFSEPYHPPKKE
jgi:hypothetical protein